MVILIGGRGFLAAYTRLALAQEERLLVAGAPPDRLALSPAESFMDHEAFAGAAGDAALRRAQAVIYFASASTPGDPTASPSSEVERAVAPVARLLERLERLGVSTRFVFISSGGTVYGRDAGSEAIPESHALAPISPYGLGKAMAEDVVRFAGRATGRSYAVLRVSNPVGRYTHSTIQGLAPAAMRAIRSGEPLRIFGDGLAERDYLSAADVADAIVAATRAGDFPAATWNVGSGRGRTVLDMLKLIETAVGRPVPVARAPSRAVDVPRVVLDCARIKADLGWTARRDLRDALLEVWSENV